jgi:hypothetical protein
MKKKKGPVTQAEWDQLIRKSLEMGMFAGFAHQRLGAPALNFKAKTPHEMMAPFQSWLRELINKQGRSLKPRAPRSHSRPTPGAPAKSRKR